MDVEIIFNDKTQRRQYHVKNTWVDGRLFCMRTAYMVTHKYPIENIHRIKEIKDPTPPGENPDFDQIREDFDYNI